ncbi:alpha/beta hydrolase [Rhodoplanes roseus]|uniref:Alpha/beta hydrolase n=1 Tax=Rhodoplanes roseus TaxID=29409 RepID=A0A327L7N7_9BRAD|nr:alpha/beta fold hydrolase [Rhodoplanes roseus]RAI45913.1 alpha/beta hydrolase [Rhodoplanes roseus]
MSRFRDLAIGVIGAIAVAVALWQLVATTAGLTIARTHVGPTPVTVYRLPDAPPAPVVVIAHGFAGSQQLMQPFAVTLARNGYVAVTFDFLGHGRNGEKLGGDVTRVQGTTTFLVDEVARIVAFAKTLPGTDGRLAVLGHSMASDIIVRYAQSDPSVAATVAISMFSPAVTADSPKNLLVVVGDWERRLKEEALRAVALSVGGPVEAGVTYGRFADGTARRAAFSPSVEHIAVLYSPASSREALAWLDAVFSRSGSGYVDDRGAWIALLIVGIVLLAKPLAGLLPRVSDRPRGAGLPWRRLWPVAVVPALLTPMILWKAPTEFLPVLVGDYLALHFGLYGILTALMLVFTQRGRHSVERSSIRRGAFALAAALLTLYSIGALGGAIDWFVTSFVPVGPRWVLVLALLGGTLPWFLADEWATRGTGAARGGYAATKLLFLMSLAAAVVLNLSKLFFLILIVPVILAFFVVYGLFSRWALARTGHPWVAGVANAVALAWAIAVTFPLLVR